MSIVNKHLLRVKNGLLIKNRKPKLKNSTDSEDNSKNKSDLKNTSSWSQNGGKENLKKLAGNILCKFVFCNKKNEGTFFQTYSKEDLDILLQRFYKNVKQANGQKYSAKTMVSIRLGLNLYFRETLKMICDITQDAEFAPSNEVFEKCLVPIQTLSLSEMKEMYEIFAANMERPDILQAKVFFDVLYQLCSEENCKSEHLVKMKKSSFRISTDGNGLRYVERIQEESHFNLKHNEKVMFETPGNSMCAVRSFKTYLSKLNPNCDFLWQHPDPQSTTDCWYTTSPIWTCNFNSIVRPVFQKYGKKLTNLCNRAIQSTPFYPLNSYYCTRYSDYKSEAPVSLVQTEVSTAERIRTSVCEGNSRNTSNLKLSDVEPVNDLHSCESLKEEKEDTIHSQPKIESQEYTTCKWYPALFITSDFSKYYEIFPLDNRGKQGMVYNLTCLLYNEVKCISEWNGFDLNNISCLAYELYSLVIPHVIDSEPNMTYFPAFVEIFDSLYSVSVGENIHLKLFSSDYQHSIERVLSDLFLSDKHIILSFRKFTTALLKCGKCSGVFVCTLESESLTLFIDKRNENLQNSKTLHLPDVDSLICFLKVFAKCSLDYNLSDDWFLLNTITISGASTTSLMDYAETLGSLHEPNRLLFARIDSNKIFFSGNKIILRHNFSDVHVDKPKGLRLLLASLLFHYQKSVEEWESKNLTDFEDLFSSVTSYGVNDSKLDWESYPEECSPEYFQISENFKVRLLSTEVNDTTWLNKDIELPKSVALLYSFGAAVIKKSEEYHVIIEELEMWNSKADLTIVTVNSLQQITSILKRIVGHLKKSTSPGMNELIARDSFTVILGEVSPLTLFPT